MIDTETLNAIEAGDRVKAEVNGRKRWLEVTNYIKSGGELQFVYCGKCQITPEQILGVKHQ